MNSTIVHAPVTLDDIRMAQERLHGVSLRTPVLRSRHLDEKAGCYAFLKAENLQRSGSIRFRGVFNHIKKHVEEDHFDAVVAYSSGNHAQAVALTARLLGMHATLLLPEDAHPAKIAAARQYGAEIEFFDRHSERPQERAAEICLKSGALPVPSTADRLTVAGYATAIVEFLEEIHDLEQLVLPLGADDMLSGCALAARSAIPDVALFGAEPARPHSPEVSIPNLDVWNLIEGVLKTTEEQLIEAQLFILERMKVLVEPTGSRAAAALLGHRLLFEGKRAGILLTSGNADFHALSASLSRYRYPDRGVRRKVVAEAYRVSCFTCRESYDAAEAVFCNCLSSERTLVCPRCMSCFCRAPMSYKDRFWQNAPQSLWDREAEEHRRDSYVRPNPEPFDVTHPLVLIVDDDPRTRLMATKVIEGLGYGAVSASNGEAGLVMARRYSPDLVLTEALMPRMDGREMCRRIKEDPVTADIKVVVATALYTQSKYRTEAFKLYRVDEYLSKPINFNDLRRVLQKHLG